MENIHDKSLQVSLDEVQGKDSKNITINPDFSDLINPNSQEPTISVDDIKKEAERLKNKLSESIDHNEIMTRLLDEIQEVDFKEEAFPKVKRLREQLEKLNPNSDEYKEIQSEIDECKLNQKHYLIISIEEILKTATNNKWSLSKKHDFVYIYNGCYWSEVEKDDLKKFLGEASEKLSVPKFDARYFNFRDNLLKQFQTTAYLPTPENDLNKVFINLKNGTFDINGENQNLRPFDKNDFITYQLPFEYNPDATCPKWQKFLDEVLPDKTLQMVLAEYLGYIFIRNGSPILKEEKALILYGTGANGKSVVFEVVNAMLGNENVSNYSLQDLTNENGYFRAKIANKLVNYASEINGKLEASVFKQLVSGEPVSARLPYGEPFTLRQYAKLIFNSNELPKDVEQTNAFFRRFLIIPFDVTIPEEKQDKNLHTKIIESELSGIFNWTLSGLNRLLKQKRFTESEKIKEAVNQYRTESDSVLMFLNERNYKKGTTGNFKTYGDFYDEYRGFCSDDGMIPVKKSNFKKRLEASQFQFDRQAGTGQNIVFVN
jgi:putative DNA primase/helicase